MDYKMVRKISLPRQITLSNRTIYKTMVRFCLFLRGDYRSLKLLTLEDKDRENYDCVSSNTITSKVEMSGQLSDNSISTLNGEKVEIDLFKLLEE